MVLAISQLIRSLLRGFHNNWTPFTNLLQISTKDSANICMIFGQPSSVKRLGRRFFLNLMSEKLFSADAVEMGIDKHMVASLCRLGNNAISMPLVSNSFSCMDITSFGCLIRS